MFTSNFIFLENEYPELSRLGLLAEKNCHEDPSTSLTKLRILSEQITLMIGDFEGFEDFENMKQFERLKALEFSSIVPKEIRDILHKLRTSGNKGAHTGIASGAEARFMLRQAFYVSSWFYELYEEESVEQEFVIPPKGIGSSETLSKIKEELKRTKEQLESFKRKVISFQSISEKQKEERKQRGRKLIRRTEETEAETRDRIDQQLRDAGWECDTRTLNFKSCKTLPKKGRNIAIAEWKCGPLRADYALFIGDELYGIVEAKKHIKNVRGDLAQAKNYAKNVQVENQISLVRHSNDKNYKVPFIFSTNGRPYLEQYKIASGIWFWDARNNNNIERALRGWFTPEELKGKMRYDESVGKQELIQTPYDLLQDPLGLSLRDYQVEAIKALESHILNNQGERRALLAMATGTGKTRTMIGMCYRLIKSKTFKRILFLVDRRMLGNQASDAFNDVKVEGLQTFAQIYDVKDLEDKATELDTKIHFATVQSLVQRIAYSDDPPGIGDYDCIVVDEAHRGYTLDRDMDDEELFLQDQLDYQSKYRMVLDHFDAYRIGLTATPALHTAEIFGQPIFNYSYRRAVVEGHLIDFEPPYVFQTELSENGIKWEKGDEVKIYDPEDNDIKDAGVVEDEIKVEIKGFNRRVITDSFNRTVLREMIENPEYGIDITTKGKTLIFAATDAHADMIVNILKEEFEDMGEEVDHEAIVKITGNVSTRKDLLRRFKNEHNPNIVVTVDLLTTGIDVPPITNLVFLRRVNSRILYDQMLGRATRRCDEIGKEAFKIIDCVGVTEIMSKEDVMKPIAPSIHKTFVNLAEEFAMIKDETKQQIKLDRIIAKLQRKVRHFEEDQIENFQRLSEEESVSDLGMKLKNMDSGSLAEYIEEKRPLWEYLDKQKASYRAKTLYSEHQDMLREVGRAYGKELKPKDYIESFVSYIKENRNKINALQIICTRPAELTRESLNELRLILDEAGFSKTRLNVAFNHTTNQEIVTDLISMIRTAALGTTLKSHEQRIEDAIHAITSNHKFNTVQLRWIEKIKKQLIQESIITIKDLNKLPFSMEGGFKRIDKAFKGETEQIINELNTYLYA